jgi:hypothetical protein
METSTTIRRMLAGNKIRVPDYQRAYSWETGTDRPVNVFFSDLTDHIVSSSRSPYYFGHFLFEKKSDGLYDVIDGQQRLTTIVIFLCALFGKLKKLRPLTEDEEETYEDMIRRHATVRFETVRYDRDLFTGYVIDRSRTDTNGLQTESAKRIVAAFNYFTHKLAGMDEPALLKLLDAVRDAACTVHQVANETEAVQMFIFQNSRGKKPSNMEIVKAKFMYCVHLHGGEEKDSLMEKIKDRFETVYRSISSIESRIDEDDVLIYVARVYFNSLREAKPVDRINGQLAGTDPLPFIEAFTRLLATGFEHLSVFFNRDEREPGPIHSLISLDGIAVALPFIIKAYAFALPKAETEQLCVALESILLRDRLIGRGADLAKRLEEDFQRFTEEKPNIQPIIDRIKWMKEVKADNYYWAFWCNDELKRVLQGYIQPKHAKFLLWKYENYLKGKGQPGYFLRYDDIQDPQWEHIAPQTENGEQEAAGYCAYDDEFRQKYLDCLGNYLLLSGSHNPSIGNESFRTVKRPSYTQLFQQREIQEMTEGDEIWDKEKIDKRKQKIIRFVMENV